MLMVGQFSCLYSLSLAGYNYSVVLCQIANVLLLTLQLMLRVKITFTNFI